MNDYFYKSRNSKKDKERGTENFNKYYKNIRKQVKDIMAKDKQS